MLGALDPRRVAGYVIITILVGILAIQYVRAIGPASHRERMAACVALRPTPFNRVLGRFPRVAPTMAAQAYTGEMVSLSAYKGQVVLLNFWAPWCPPCVEEMPSLEALQRQLGGEPFTLLTVVSETQWPKVHDFFPKGTNLTVLIDPPPRAEEGKVGTIASRFGTDKLPETYLIDKDGTIRYYFVAERDWSSQNALQCVRSLIEE